MAGMFSNAAVESDWQGSTAFVPTVVVQSSGIFSGLQEAKTDTPAVPVESDTVITTALDPLRWPPLALDLPPLTQGESNIVLTSIQKLQTNCNRWNISSHLDLSYTGGCFSRGAKSQSELTWHITYAGAAHLAVALHHHGQYSTRNWKEILLILHQPIGKKRYSAKEKVFKLLRSYLCCEVTTINFRGNNIGSRGAFSFASLLPTTHITTIDLYGNNIGDQGAVAFATALPSTSVTSINLEKNNIKEEGVAALAAALPATQVININYEAGNYDDDMIFVPFNINLLYGLQNKNGTNILISDSSRKVILYSSEGEKFEVGRHVAAMSQLINSKYLVFYL